MSNIIRSAARALACAVVGSLTVLAAPAQAELTITMDRNLDNREDFKKVAVRHGEKRVRFQSRVFDRRGLPEWVYHQVDTRGGPKPEFSVSVIVKNEVAKRPHVTIHRVDSWLPRENPWKGHDEEVECGLHVGDKRDKKRVLRVLTGRGCFQIDGEMPNRVRVNTFGGYIEFPGIEDPVPAWREYGSWTSAD